MGQPPRCSDLGRQPQSHVPVSGLSETAGDSLPSSLGTELAPFQGLRCFPQAWPWLCCYPATPNTLLHLGEALRAKASSLISKTAGADTCFGAQEWCVLCAAAQNEGVPVCRSAGRRRARSPPLAEIPASPQAAASCCRELAASETFNSRKLELQFNWLQKGVLKGKHKHRWAQEVRI